MYVAQPIPGSKAPIAKVESSVCPHREAESAHCPAAVMRMPIARRWDKTYCLTEDFDCCPVFLAKVLRGN